MRALAVKCVPAPTQQAGCRALNPADRGNDVDWMFSHQPSQRLSASRLDITSPCLFTHCTDMSAPNAFVPVYNPAAPHGHGPVRLGNSRNSNKQGPPAFQHKHSCYKHPKNFCICASTSNRLVVRTSEVVRKVREVTCAKYRSHAKCATWTRRWYSPPRPPA